MKTERTIHETSLDANSQAATAGESSQPLLTEAEIRVMPESDYMNDPQLAFFRDLLERESQKLLANEVDQGAAMREHEHAADPVDRASQEETHSMGALARARHTRLYTEMRQAIARIDKGDFGYCTETGEPIGIPRLLSLPTATMTVDAQDRLEKRSRTFASAQ